jgi:hypothetical protein
MREWHAIFADNPNYEPELVERGALRWPQFGKFAAAAAAGKIGNRAVKGMWVLDPESEHADALAIYGRLPESIIEKVSGRTKRFPTKRHRLKEKPQR